MKIASDKILPLWPAFAAPYEMSVRCQAQADANRLCREPIETLLIDNVVQANTQNPTTSTIAYGISRRAITHSAQKCMN